MSIGIVFLTLAYILSQFYRAFLAVLTLDLGADLGAGPDDLALSSGLWFLVFAAMQIPVGWALDTIGPRRTTAWLLGVFGGGGAAIFAVASAPWHLHVAMALIGVGCSPVLMASFYIFGRMYRPAMFATLAGALIGVGTLGNIAGAYPLAWAAQVFGWRESVGALAVVTVLVAVVIARVVQDPPALQAGGPAGTLWDVVKIPGIWLILPLLFVNYAPAAGLRGLWIGPYLSDTYGVSSTVLGYATLAMALAMVVGAAGYGQLDRLFGTRKRVALAGNLLLVALLAGLWMNPEPGVWLSALMLSGIGMLGLSYPLLMAHGRAFFPPHLLGRGVTLLNMASIGGVGVLQVVSRRVWDSAPDATASAPYAALFLFYALLVLLGCAIYMFSTDRTD